MAVYKEKESSPVKVSSGFERRVSHLENLMVAVCDFTNGPAPRPDPLHSHPHEQILYVAEGELFFFIGDEKHHILKGDICTIPSGVPHSIQIISKHVRLIDSFSPVRQDFLKIKEN
jgi:quercetin dioxygenase-like cupin family protein